MFECWNCHKKVESEEYQVASYKGWDMFVCQECADKFKKLQSNE
jgi:hypothetical protein